MFFVSMLTLNHLILFSRCSLHTVAFKTTHKVYFIQVSLCNNYSSHSSAVRLPVVFAAGVVEEIILEARLVPKPSSPCKEDLQYIAGLADYYCEIREHIQLNESDMVELSQEGERELQVVDFSCFTPGSVIAFKSVHISGCISSSVKFVTFCLSLLYHF